MMIDENADPFDLFPTWFAEATKGEPVDPNAMTIASVDADGMPNARTVLMKAWSREGFVFYTNLQSTKGAELLGQPKASLLFHWKSQKRQIRAQGVIAQVSDAVADAYFATRARESQLGAWASDQSQPLDDRATFEERISAAEERFTGKDVARPPHWSGFCLQPEVMEFWQDREFRLHDRVQFRRMGDAWRGQRLFP